MTRMNTSIVKKYALILSILLGFSSFTLYRQHQLLPTTQGDYDNDSSTIIALKESYHDSTIISNNEMGSENSFLKDLNDGVWSTKMKSNPNVLHNDDEIMDVNPSTTELKVEIANKDSMPLWVKAPRHEIDKHHNQPCNNQFKHCCVGQCRQNDLRLDPEEVLLKWNDERPGGRRLFQLSDVLDLMGEDKSRKSCNINFFGDSLSSDHLMAAMCDLTNNGYEMKSCTSAVGGTNYGEDNNIQCENEAYNGERLRGIPHFALENNFAKSCPKVFLSLITPKPRDKIERRMNKLANIAGTDGFLYVYNWGNHCNSKNSTCLRDELEHSLVPYASSEKYQHFTFLFRESEPQHFDSPGGLWPNDPNFVIDKCVDTKGQADNWRNEEVVRILADHKLTEKVPVVPLFDSLEPLWQTHHNSDCTHYCYNPYRFEVTWDGIVNQMLALKRRSNEEATASGLKQAIEVSTSPKRQVKEKYEQGNHAVEPLWIKAGKAERRVLVEKSCNQKFEHCCVGHCRRKDTRISPNKALWKWNSNRLGANPLANITKVLDYIHHRLEYLETSPKSQRKSCNINFFGDSLSSDHVMDAACQLMSVGYELIGCQPVMGGQNYGDDNMRKCETVVYNGVNLTGIPHFALENNETTSCPRVFISFLNHRPRHLFKRRMNKLDMAGPDGFVNIYNWGVHCNGQNKTCLWDELEHTLVSYANSTEYAHWTFLFRESEPQHFSTPGGLWPESIEEQLQLNRCVDTQGNADNWRNEEVVRILEAHNLTTRVPIVPIFDALEPLWRLHHPQDCTHYCYNPYRFDVTWDGILNALIPYDKEHIKSMKEVFAEKKAFFLPSPSRLARIFSFFSKNKQR